MAVDYVDYEEGRALLAEYNRCYAVLLGEGEGSDLANEAAWRTHDARRDLEQFMFAHAEALLNPDPWRPIEELPQEWKDGRDVCVSDGLGVYGNARWHPTEECWLNCDGCVPTHFRELKGPGQ